MKTKKEFAEMCGIMTKHISTYEKRRLIVIEKDGKIDDSNEVNYAFLIQKGFVESKKKNGTADGRSTKKSVTKKPTAKKVVAKKTTAKPGAKKKPEPKPEKHEPLKKTPEQLEIEYERQQRIEKLASMDRDKLQADTDKKRHDAEIARIKLEKLQGLLIPTDLVTSVIQLQAASLRKSYHEAAEKLIIIFSQKKKLTNKEMGELRRELTGVVNDAIDSGIEESKKGIGRIVKEYSEVRGVGESA